MKPLSVGNVVSAGLKIYRDRFKDYYRLAFIGALWSWIPIYGWAKFAAAMGLISHLAYGEVAEKPESIKDARRHIKPRMWRFVGLALVISLRFLGFYFLWSIGLLLFAFIGAAIENILRLENKLVFIANALIFVFFMLAFLSFFALIVWLMSRYLIADLPIAVEENVNVNQAIKRSVELTKGQITRVYLVVIITGLVTIPLWTLAIFLQLIPEYINNYNLGIFRPVLSLFALVLSSATSAFIVPVWQSIKAVIYYDLLIRKEGLGLNLEGLNDNDNFTSE